MKKNLVFYSDCRLFSGCENMLVNFFSSLKLSEAYNIYFIYRDSKEYFAGYKARIKQSVEVQLIPIKITRVDDLLTVKNKLLRYMLYVPIHYYVIIKNIFFIKKVLRSLSIRIDILHINNAGYPGAYSALSCVIAAKILNIKNVLMVVNNIANNYKLLTRKLDYFIDRWVSRWVDVFVTGSRDALLNLQKVLMLKDSKLAQIYNGVAARKIEESAENVLKRIQATENVLKIGVVAVLEERKGHVFLFEAMKMLKQNILKNNNFKMPQLFIAGDGEIKEELIKFINENKLNDCIIMLGNESNAFNFINCMDVIIQPSISHEDFPFAVIEAMSLSKPIIGTKIAGIPEQIDNNLNGFLIEPRNSLQLAESIMKFINKPELINEYGKNSYNKYLSLFTPETAIDKYMELYNRCFNNSQI